jgi:hypothetical protein
MCVLFAFQEIEEIYKHYFFNTGILDMFFSKIQIETFAADIYFDTLQMNGLAIFPKVHHCLKWCMCGIYNTALIIFPKSAYTGEFFLERIVTVM